MIIPATYSQDSVYALDGILAATEESMTNGITAETVYTTNTGTVNPSWIKMDFGSEKTFESVVVGSDFTNTLGAGDWGVTYAQNFLIQGSNDDSSWTTIGNTGTFSSALKTISTPGSSYRYVRLAKLANAFLAITEFYADDGVATTTTTTTTTSTTTTPATVDSGNSPSNLAMRLGI